MTHLSSDYNPRRGHVPQFDLMRSSLRPPFVQGFKGPCEKRFDNINKLPTISTQSQNVMSINFGNKKGRNKLLQEPFCKAEYCPNESSIRVETGKVMKFNLQTHRKLQHSIYQQQQSPDHGQYKIQPCFQQLGDFKKSKTPRFGNVRGRDNLLYTQTEMMRNIQMENRKEHEDENRKKLRENEDMNLRNTFYI